MSGCHWRWVSGWVAVLSLTCAAAARGQVNSGPAVGDKVEGFTVFALTGDDADKEFDPLAERGDKPTVVLFVRADAFDRPMARYLRELDAKLADHPEARAVAVWLTDDVDKSKEYLPRAQQSLKFERLTLAVFGGEPTGPNNWGVNDQARLTTVITRGGRAAASFAYVSVNETDVPEALKALKN